MISPDTAPGSPTLSVPTFAHIRPGACWICTINLEGVQKSDPGVAILCGLADPSDLAMDGSE